MSKLYGRAFDSRMPEVRRTIDAIKAMGLECTRTTRTPGEYRIEKRLGDVAIVRYASTSNEALAVAKRMLTEKK